MSEMLEKVARAIDVASFGQFSEGFARDLAGAAIRALREPNEEMLAAFDPEWMFYCPMTEFRNAWGAAIDSILTDKEPRA